MVIESVLITGATRGIGLELVRQLSQLEQPPLYVFATYRNSYALQELISIQDACEKCEVILLKMDVTQADEIEASKQIIEEIVGDRGLTLLINNAGVAESLPFPHISPENLDKHFKVNTLGPIQVLQVMLPLLEKAAALGDTNKMSVSRSAVLNLSSMTGSITNTGEILTVDLALPSYKISKAALNMAMRTFAASVKDKGILVIMMCPGWVKDIAALKTEESVANMIQTLEKLDESHHGCFMDRFAEKCPF